MGDGIVAKEIKAEHQLIAISSNKISGMKVVNLQHKEIGEIRDIVIDMRANRISYGVLSYGGFAGIGKKLFAIPWEAFSMKDEAMFVKGKERELVLNIPKEALKESEGFDEKNWPAEPDYHWLSSVYSRYGVKPYWEG